jgi:hypothetical protein
MKIDIIVYTPGSVGRHGYRFAPPIAGIRLAALTPVCYPVKVFHPPFDPLRLATDADLIVLFVDDNFVDIAYRWADWYSAHGKSVVACGLPVIASPHCALEHCDAVVIGEIEPIWAEVVRDAAAARLCEHYTTIKISTSQGYLKVATIG